MTPIAWWIAANTAVTAIAVVLAAWAFLRADQHMRHARNVVQAHERCGRCRAPHLRRGEYATGGRVPPEGQPHGDLPLLCGDENTRLMPARGDLAGGEHR